MYEQKTNKELKPGINDGTPLADEFGLCTGSFLSDRIANLQEIERRNQTQYPWNCFSAVQFVAASNTLPLLINHMPEFGQKTDIDIALSTLRRPFVFQIIGRYELPAEFNMGTEEFTGVIHSGIVLREDRNNSLIKIFEKNSWQGKLQTSAWHKVIQRFLGDIDYFRFFEANDRQFQAWCKSYDQ